MKLIDEIKERWKQLLYKAPLKEGDVGYFKYGWTTVFLERAAKMEGGRRQLSILSFLSRQDKGLAEM